MSFRFPQCVPTNLKTLIPNASKEAIALMQDMLQWDPKKRPTAVQKAASMGSENALGGSGMGLLKSGRRRWGQAVSKTSDSWDESDQSETAASNSKKPSLRTAEEDRSSKEHCSQPKEQKPLYSFSTVTKIPNNVKVGPTDSNLPGSAARQHYLTQSRYLPGLIGKNQTSSGEKELGGMTLRGLWENSSNTVNKPICPIGGGLAVTRANAGNFVSTKYNLSSGYIPSFQKKEVGTVGQRIQLAPLAGQHSNYEGWKRRADRTQVKDSSFIALGKTSGNLLSRAPAVPPVHGRVDWTSKYGGNR
ncbi:hypothetical protein GOODEAATRI_015975 [Goodea atripinnis]|uniref:Serine/threonine-protein kinase MAK n=1 Tax=Goodea atripinnis TaxID=208336 RepID=A0ABV0NAX5_9TELE